MDQLSFWDRSWKAVDPERIDACAGRTASVEDPLIQILRQRGAVHICDAGCGGGIFSLRLAACGFHVSGFDISADAAALARRLLMDRGYPAPDFRAADIRATEYADGTFDAAVARSVIDHLPLTDGVAAVRELLRIVRPGGCVLLTLDGTDREYEAEPHERNVDGDYLYTGGKWEGMVFHPWSPDELACLTQGCETEIRPSPGGGYTLVLEKRRAGE